MAIKYPKVYPDLENQTVPDYERKQEDRIENAFDNVASEFDATKITSGSNSDGYWTKFPDGTMICRYMGEVTATIDVPWGNLYREDLGRSHSFAQPFVGKPFCKVSSYSGGASDAYISGLKNNSTTFRFIKGNVETQATITYGILAIGRWK